MATTSHPLRRRASWSLSLIALALAIPIFVEIRGGIHLAPRFSNEAVGAMILPLSYLLLPFAILVPFASRLQMRCAPVLLTSICGIAMLYFAGLVWGLLSGAIDDTLYRSSARFAQSVFPLGAALVASHVMLTMVSRPDRPAAFARLIERFALFSAIFLAGYAVQTIFSGSTSRFALLADHIGPFVNPKIKRFFPVILALSATFFLSRAMLALALRGRIRPIDLALGLALAAGLVTFWSRTAILTLAIGLGASLIYLQGSPRRIVMIVWGLTGLVAGAVVVQSVEIAALTSLQRSLDTVLSIFSTAAPDNAGDAIRMDRILFAIDAMLRSPVGSGFETFRQPLFPIEDIAVAENGIIDVGVRGGLGAVVLMIFLLGRGLLRVHRAGRTGTMSERAAATVFIALVAGALPWLHVASEAYFSILFWFLVGAANSLPSSPAQTASAKLPSSETQDGRLQVEAPGPAS